MIWYRHWIEMRSGLCVAAIFMALMSLLCQLLVSGGTHWFAQSGHIIKELDVLTPHLAAMDPAHFLPWGAHTWASAAAAVIVGIFLAGTGIRTNGFQPGHKSMYYTLTLPISRFELVWTRFASACAALYILFAAMLVVDCAFLLVMRQPVPLGPMAVSSFLAGLFVAPVMAVFGVLVALWKEQWSGLVFVAIAATTQWAWPTLLRFTGSQDIPWLWIGAIFLITGAALSTAAILARRQEF
ncbi:MAG: hypothetical protein LAO55_13460 [Acidobacteriia bacterium]|nr:hypothetical protein [Terriglobia bacterium]